MKSLIALAIMSASLCNGLAQSVPTTIAHPESLQQNPPGVAREANPKPGLETAATNADVGSAEWLQKTLARGDMKSVVNVGSNYLFGTGVPQDQKWAVTLFLSAAVCGDSDAKRF